MTDPMFTLDDIAQLLSDHMYWSGDDMTDADCSCDEWPVYRNGKPTEDWIEHVMKAAQRMKEPTI